MEILMEKHLFALRHRQLVECRDRGLEQALLERLPDPLPLVADRARPPGGLVGERPERRPGRLPEARQEIDENLERAVPERSSGPAPLEEQRVTVVVAGQQAQPIRAGDIVWIPADERHWHGAAADSYLLHTAISLGQTNWQDEVVEADYAGATV